MQISTKLVIDPTTTINDPLKYCNVRSLPSDIKITFCKFIDNLHLGTKSNTVFYKWVILLVKCGRPDFNVSGLKWIIGTHGNWKNQNPGGRFGATSRSAVPIQPIYHKNGPNGLNWQCSLAGSSKTASRILIFSIAMGAKPSF